MNFTNYNDSMAHHKTTHTQLDRYRIIDSLLSKASAERPVPFSELFSHVKSKTENPDLSERTLRRDLEYMRKKLDAPISYKKSSSLDSREGYFYLTSFNFPVKNISDEDLLGLAIIKKILSQFNNKDAVYAKAASLLENLFPSINSLSFIERIEVSKRPIPVYDKNMFQNILLALKNNFTVHFDYRSEWEPKKIHRQVLPYQIVLDEGQIFLFAADENDKSATRLYNLARITELQVKKDKKFTLPEKYFRFTQDFEKGRWGAFQYDENYNFKIEVYGKARRFLHERLWADDQHFDEFSDEDKTIMTFSSSQWIPIERWLLQFGSEARPLSPEWFVSDWKKQVLAMAKLAQNDNWSKMEFKI